MSRILFASALAALAMLWGGGLASAQQSGTAAEARAMLDRAVVVLKADKASGFLGMGEDYYPMPWPNMKYDSNLGGYRTAITESQLKGAPKFNRNTDWDWSNRARDQEVYDYYRTPMWY